jgi:predicted dithiol-disulfide oxidoreductase (DUF899 family)
MGAAENNDIPPMWPAGTSDEYITARIELAKAERTLRDQIEQVAAARRKLPEGAVIQDYPLTEGPKNLEQDEPTRTVRLSELFGEHDTLFVYHLMYHPDDNEACPMCSLWVDGFHGVSHHLAQHTAVAVIGKAPLSKLRAWAYRRGWDGLRILSSHGTTFNADMHAEHLNGDQRPMASVFVKDGGRIRHFYTLPANFIDDTERGMDLLSPVWNILDLLPTGRGTWYAGNSYAGRERG